MEAGAAVLGQRMIGFTKKIVIIVDKDVDPFDLPQVMNALGTRWQPVPGTLLIPQMVSMPLDPSQKEKFLSSKVIIDATRQLPSEGGPESWVPTNRCLMDEKSPDSFKLVDSKWDEYFKKK
jgi:3-polyprenyl-4-hydroxybenzoate decarboxylase